MSRIQYDQHSRSRTCAHRQHDDTPHYKCTLSIWYAYRHGDHDDRRQHGSTQRKSNQVSRNTFPSFPGSILHSIAVSLTGDLLKQPQYTRQVNTTIVYACCPAWLPDSTRCLLMSDLSARRLRCNSTPETGVHSILTHCALLADMQLDYILHTPDITAINRFRE